MPWLHLFTQTQIMMHCLGIRIPAVSCNVLCCVCAENENMSEEDEQIQHLDLIQKDW